MCAATGNKIGQWRPWAPQTWSGPEPLYGAAARSGRGSASPVHDTGVTFISRYHGNDRSLRLVRPRLSAAKREDNQIWPNLSSARTRLYTRWQRHADCCCRRCGLRRVPYRWRGMAPDHGGRGRRAPDHRQPEALTLPAGRSGRPCSASPSPGRHRRRFIATGRIIHAPPATITDERDFNIEPA